MFKRQALKGVSRLGLEGTFDFLDLVGFDNVAFLDVVEVLDAKTAVVSGGNFLDVVLASFQRCQDAFLDDDTIADDSDLCGSCDLTFFDHTAGDCSDLGNLEGLPYFQCGGYNFLLHRGEHTFYTALDLVDCIVDD